MSIPSYKAVIKRYSSAPSEVRDYFTYLPALVQDYPYDVCLAYMFIRVERAQNMALYCGVVKLHAADATVASSVIERQHITRDSFLDLFENVFGQPLDPAVAKHLKFAEKVRDRTVHGKSVTDANFRKALVEILDYADSFNAAVSKRAGFKPFGDLRGFKGRATSLGKGTTRWLLKGLGFAVS